MIKKTNIPGCIAFITLVLLAGAPIIAQAQSLPRSGVNDTGSTADLRRIPVEADTASQRASEDPDDLVIMSPFVVNVEKDTGFVAASSLAGGRLAGDLRDTPVAYSVMTKEFIEALQLTDLTDISRWATNTMDAPTDGTEYAVTSGDSAMRITSRGMGSNTPQRNFFPVYYNFDSYNIERLDLARGPNAVLFGTSSLGGTANSVTKRAITGRILGEARISFGSWANFRVTADYNQPLGKKLAVRVNVLHQDREGWRDMENEGRQGVTLAALWKPFRNTEIRLEGERGRMERSIVTNVMDYLSGWDGISTFSASTTANAAKGVAVYGMHSAIYTPSVGNMLINYHGWARTLGGRNTADVKAGGVAVPGDSPYIEGSSLLEQINLPASLYDLAIGKSFFVMPDRKYSTFSDERLFKVDTEDLTLSVTQRIGRKLFLEIALNKGTEDTDTDLGIARGMNRIYIDVNEKLPNGESNANFLQPYAECPVNPYILYRDKENARLALGYVTGPTNVGSYSFNLMGGISNQKFDRNGYRYVLKDPSVASYLWPTNSSIYHRYYLNQDTTRPRPMPDSWTYVNPRNNTTSTLPAGLARDVSNATFNQIAAIDYKYVQAALSGKTFNDRLSIVLSARMDHYKTHQETMLAQYDHPSDWDAYTRFVKPPAPSDWETLSYRLRADDGTPYGSALPANTRPRTGNANSAINPLYRNDRFQDDYSPPDSEDTITSISTGAVYHVFDWISVFGNYAESFVPPSSGIRLNGSLFAARLSKGWDAGFRFNFLKGRVIATASYYEGRETGASITATTFPFNNILNARPYDSGVSGEINKYLPMLPLGYSDISNNETTGFEFEVTANMTKNWRLMFNAALPEAYYTGRNNDSRDYYNTHKETLRQIVIDAGGSFVGDYAQFTQQQGANSTLGPASVNAWNTIQNSLASITAEKQKRTRVPDVNMNLFTDYTFRTGFLKGLRIGAGVNYRGRQVVGYRGADTIVDPANPQQVIDDPAVGPKDTVNIDGYATAVLTLNYSWRISRKLIASLDIKLDNVFDYDKPIYYDTAMRPRNGDLTTPARVATPNNYYWVTPRNLFFTVQVKF